MSGVWAVLPAAGAGRRFGGATPKQYLDIAGQPVIAHSLDAALADPRVDGAMVALAADDPCWPGWTARGARPVRTCIGGAERAHSVLAALDALAREAGDDALVLVHDAARPHLDAADLARLIDAALACDDGAVLGAPVRDTLRRVDLGRRSAGTVSRESLWRAFTPQAARLGVLRDALRGALAAGLPVTDEAVALEHAGRRPVLVEGRDDNLKITTAADLAVATFLLRSRTLSENA
ncbi:2-C-methyl-D-erythritol 4-phosphate cytidylyltransferase [Lysobacter xanthus]